MDPIDITQEITQSRPMAINKSEQKGKKPSHSADKPNEGRLTQLFKEITNKMVNKAKPQANAGAKTSVTKSDKKQSVAVEASNKPSTLSGSSAPVAAEKSKAPVVTTAATDVVVDDAEVVLTDAEGRRYCRATDCDQIGLVDGYCRYHYLYFWKKIQIRKRILADGKLERYIEELTARYTDKFIELLRKDLRTEKDFLAAVQELELDDSASASPQDEDEAKTYLEEISGVATDSPREDEGY